MIATRLLYSLAGAVLIMAFLAGALQYGSIPDPLPTHWGPSGAPDAFAPKGFWTVFALPVIGVLLTVCIGTSNWLLARSKAIGPVERETVGLAMGYMALFLSAIFSWLALASWRGEELGPWFIVVVLLSTVPALVLVGLRWSALTKERREREGTDDPSADAKYWRWGGTLYNNPNDPRVFVQQRAKWSMNFVPNLGNPWGRLITGLLAVLLVGALALPLLLY